MNIKKLAVGTVALAVLIVLAVWIKQNSSNTRKICSSSKHLANKITCQECSCPKGQPIPGIEDSVACPDGAKPTCNVVEEK
jgi:hypothetical protein